MTTTYYDLPDYLASTPTDPKPPRELMLEAAEALEARTNGLVGASVFTSNPGGTNLFRHTFYLKAAALDNFTYPLFYVWHDAAFYDAHLLPAGGVQATDTIDYKTPVELHQGIEELLRSPVAVQLIRSVAAQARSVRGGTAAA